MLTPVFRSLLRDGPCAALDVDFGMRQAPALASSLAGGNQQPHDSIEVTFQIATSSSSPSTRSRDGGAFGLGEPMTGFTSVNPLSIAHAYIPESTLRARTAAICPFSRVMINTRAATSRRV